MNLLDVFLGLTTTAVATWCVGVAARGYRRSRALGHYLWATTLAVFGLTAGCSVVARHLGADFTACAWSLAGATLGLAILLMMIAHEREGVRDGTPWRSLILFACYVCSSTILYSGITSERGGALIVALALAIAMGLATTAGPDRPLGAGGRWFVGLVAVSYLLFAAGGAGTAIASSFVRLAACVVWGWAARAEQRIAALADDFRRSVLAVERRRKTDRKLREFDEITRVFRHGGGQSDAGP